MEFSPRPNGQVSGPSPDASPSLNVTGFVISKADLVTALRLYVPQLADISSLAPDRFLLSLSPSAPSPGESESVLADYTCTNFPPNLGSITFSSSSDTPLGGGISFGIAPGIFIQLSGLLT